MRPSRTSVIVLSWGLSLCATTGLIRGQEAESPVVAGISPTQFYKSETIRILEGETRSGDAYFLGRTVSVYGRQLGDLIGLAQIGVISGEVDGDVGFLGQSLEVTESGRVLDTLRFFGDTLLIIGPAGITESLR